ncbi:MAG: transposase, partial [Candidatus Accumulibacter sp.]|nr:transposase [Accumulibacter sp.]
AITDKQVAETGFKLLIRWPRGSRNEYMKTLANTPQNHFENIMNYFDDRLTNAILECLNNIIQSIKHAARGFKNCEYLKAISYLRCEAFEVTVT